MLVRCTTSNTVPTSVVTDVQGAWTGDEDGIQESVQLHGGKDWVAIAALVQVEREFKCTTDGMLLKLA
jgi:hypothetical protein